MRTYIVYCEPCGYKKLVEDPLNVDLSNNPSSQVQGRLPTLNKATGKAQVFDEIKRMPRFKCPQCGRGVILRKYNVPMSRPNEPEPKKEPDSSE